MITNGILLIVKGVIEVLLSPFTVLNIAIDFIGQIPFIVDFVEIVAYVLPWSNILPIITIIFAIFVFRIIGSLFNLLLKVIPFIG